ncbi:MAG: mRNA surveillance protein pelota [Promethearchaeota archaeon]
MKILEDNLKHGELFVMVESLNDLWTLYNVIAKGDMVSTKTHRRVVLKEGSKGERKPMRLKIKVESLSFHEFSNRLRIKGTILEGPDEFVSYGKYHTFNIKIGQRLSIIKEEWLKHDLHRLKESSKFESNYIMIIVSIETGLATLSLITNFSHNRIATIKKNIPGKRYEQSYRNKALQDFFETIHEVIKENIKNIKVNLIVVCGPGNTRELFIKYIREKYKPDYLATVKICHASSGTESGILEVLKSKELASIKKKVKILKETEKIEEIFTLFSKDADLIVIGFDENLKASERGAIKHLFIVDILIRGTSKENKLKIEKIITNVEKAGGNIDILSSEHPTGQQIIDLGSIVGILRYKL